MNLLKVSNALKLLCDAHPRIASYHFGYVQDINYNVPNVYDPENAVGTIFPLLLFAGPVDGTTTLSDSRLVDFPEVELMLFDNATVSGADNVPKEATATHLTQWNALKRDALEVVYALGKLKGFSIKDGAVDWYFDKGLGADGLLCVGVKFRLVDPAGCAELLEGRQIWEGLPDISELVDLEFVNPTP